MRDPDTINDLLEEQYGEWLEENYSYTEIKDGNYPSFEDWAYEKWKDSSIYIDELDYEQHLA